VKAVHEIGEALEQFAAPAAALEHPEVEPRVEIQQQAFQPRFPSQAVAGRPHMKFTRAADAHDRRQASYRKRHRRPMAQPFDRNMTRFPGFCTRCGL
jgi:hypothetical protein